MIKVMHVDNVFEVFIFLILIFGYFFYARRGAYLIMFILLKTFSGASRHNPVKKSSKFKPPCNNHPINAATWMEEKNYFCTHIYHRDHNERLIRAIYVGARLNQY